MTKIIGLSGYARTGKNEAAKALAVDGYIPLAFADSLRSCLYTLNPFIDKDYRLAQAVDSYGWDRAKVMYDEVRQLLQRMGTDVGRKLIDDNIWVNITLSNLDKNGKYVVTDCRFPNEALAIKKMGGLVIRINRMGIGPVNNHASETSLDDFPFDIYVDNNYDVDHLHSMMRSLLLG